MLLDYKLIKCPKCGKSHFIKTAQSTNGMFMDLLEGYGIHDGVYRKEAQPIYKDGEIENPEELTPAESKDYFQCLECNDNFYVKTTWEYVGGDVGYSPSYETIDKDKEDAERESAWEKQLEENRKKREAEEQARQERLKSGNFVTMQPVQSDIAMVSDYITLDIPLITNKAITTIGDGNNSEIDLGGIIIKSNIIYSEKQIKNIEEYFGWKVTNK